MAVKDRNKPKERGERLVVFNKTGGMCAYCGCQLSLDSFGFHIDHIKPKRRYDGEFHTFKHLEKGTDDVDNLLPCCQSCNSTKSDLTIDEFRQKVQGRIDVLNRNSSEYRTAKRFGLINENQTRVVFYFEKIQLKINGTS